MNKAEEDALIQQYKSALAIPEDREWALLSAIRAAYALGVADEKERAAMKARDLFNLCGKDADGEDYAAAIRRANENDQGVGGGG